MPWNRTQHQGLRVGLKIEQSYGGATRKQSGSTLCGCPLVQGGRKVDLYSAGAGRAGVWSSTGNRPVLPSLVERAIAGGFEMLLARFQSGEEIVDTATSLQPWQGTAGDIELVLSRGPLTTDFRGILSSQRKSSKLGSAVYPTKLRNWLWKSSQGQLEDNVKIFSHSSRPTLAKKDCGGSLWLSWAICFVFPMRKQREVFPINGLR
jgi:hypothetical protein